MTLNFAGVFADAAALWKRERALIVPIAGVFFLLPMLGIMLLLGGSGLTEAQTQEAMRAAMQAFYEANIVAILLANMVLDFGTFAVLNLFLQGGGRTLGEVLMLSLRRFMVFLVIALITGLLYGLGLSLFIVPGLYFFARTWLAGPAYTAAPARGMLDAFRQSWVQTRGFNWLVILGATAAVLLVALLMVFFATAVLALLGSFAGGALVATGYLVTAAIFGLAWAQLAVLRVAIYSRVAPSNGI